MFGVNTEHLSNFVDLLGFGCLFGYCANCKKYHIATN